MHFKGLDLNLLVALETLLTEENVTRAAQKLHLSQSATSSALARLRSHFGDELLIPAGRRFILSNRAKSLLPIIRSILAQIDQQVIRDNRFDPATDDRLVRIMVSDYVSLTVLQPSLALISRHAPRVRFEIVPVDTQPSVAIETHSVDILIAPEPFTSALHPKALYFDDDYVCLVDEGNTLCGNELALEQYLGLPHGVVRFVGRDRTTYDDSIVEGLGYKKNISIIVPTHATLPQCVLGTNRIVTLQRRQADLFARHNAVRYLAPPITIPPIREFIQWHSLNEKDELLNWIRSQLLSSVELGCQA